MARYQVVLAYDGTQFAGFQRLHSKGKVPKDRTVQGVFETALSRLGWAGKSILSAGRTDSGVHAAGQVVVFDLDWRHSSEELCHALNAHLPADVAARSVRVTADDFHPRYAARARRYSYQIFCQANRDPLRERYAWRVWPEVDAALMIEAAGMLVGERDFAAFGTPPRPGGSTLRTVWQARWVPWAQDPCQPGLGGSGLRFEIVANAFLYHMVRRLVYIQVQIGQGRLELHELASAFSEGSLRLTGLAPAQGLVLMEVSYNDEMFIS
jgi:tRNA pseudouridine38-40 synthase